MWRAPSCALLAGLTALAAGCSSAPLGTFHPAGAGPAGSGPSRLGLSRPGQSWPQAVVWPPFGRDVRVIMPGWQPASAAEVPAVVAAKDFLLAYLYAEYRGGADRRWTAYVAPDVASTLGAQLAQPDVATQSFTGTIRFSRLTAFPDPARPGAVVVSECFDNSHAANVGLHTRRVIPDRTPPGQHFYRNTDAFAADAHGRWRLVAIYPVIYYPQAKECKA